jgi:Large polyvalent protein associated domain 29
MVFDGAPWWNVSVTRI